MTDLNTALQRMEAAYNRDKGVRDHLIEEQRQVEAERRRVQDDLELWDQVQILLREASEYARRQMVSHIEQTVTAALQSIFGEGLECRVTLRTLNNQPAAEIEVVSRYGDVEIAADPESARGGGVVDVVSLALRLALLELHEPKIEGPLVLDEPGKHVSEEYVQNLAVFLKEYSAQTGRQIIMVTHQPRLAEVADQAYTVSQRNGVSEVKPA